MCTEWNKKNSLLVVGGQGLLRDLPRLLHLGALLGDPLLLARLQAPEQGQRHHQRVPDAAEIPG